MFQLMLSEGRVLLTKGIVTLGDALYVTRSSLLQLVQGADVCSAQALSKLLAYPGHLPEHVHLHIRLKWRCVVDDFAAQIACLYWVSVAGTLVLSQSCRPGLSCKLCKLPIYGE